MKALLLILLLMPAGHAAQRWLRYVGAASVCGLAAADIGTTAIGTSQGGHETNPLLAHGGKPRWGRMIGLNVGVCAASIAVSRPQSPPFLQWGLTIPLAATKAYAVTHNVRELRRMADRPGPILVPVPSDR